MRYRRGPNTIGNFTSKPKHSKTSRTWMWTNSMHLETTPTINELRDQYAIRDPSMSAWFAIMEVKPEDRTYSEEALFKSDKNMCQHIVPQSKLLARLLMFWDLATRPPGKSAIILILVCPMNCWENKEATRDVTMAARRYLQQPNRSTLMLLHHTTHWVCAPVICDPANHIDVTNSHTERMNWLWCSLHCICNGSARGCLNESVNLPNTAPNKRNPNPSLKHQVNLLWDENNRFRKGLASCWIWKLCVLAKSHFAHEIGATWLGRRQNSKPHSNEMTYVAT